MYKIAAQNKIRFTSNRGLLTVEQLFDLPLSSKSNFDLDTIAKTINKQLKEMGEESFVGVSNPAKKEMETALEIVKDVIKSKQEENAAQLNKLKKREQQKKILDAIAAKKDQQLSQTSLDELEKQLAELDN